MSDGDALSLHSLWGPSKKYIFSRQRGWSARSENHTRRLSLSERYHSAHKVRRSAVVLGKKCDFAFRTLFISFYFAHVTPPNRTHISLVRLTRRRWRLFHHGQFLACAFIAAALALVLRKRTHAPLGIARKCGCGLLNFYWDQRDEGHGVKQPKRNQRRFFPCRFVARCCLFLFYFGSTIFK